MSDALVGWAFERQRACDPANSAYYFECFDSIARGRESDSLQFEVARLRSEGEFTLGDLDACYRALGIEPRISDDNLIIGVFTSRLADAPRQEGRMRDDMRVIGTYLKSDKILRCARMGEFKPTRSHP